MFRPTTFSVYTDVPQKADINEVNVNSEYAKQMMSQRENSQVSKTQRFESLATAKENPDKINQSKQNLTRPKGMDRAIGHQKSSLDNPATRSRSAMRAAGLRAGQPQVTTTKQHEVTTKGHVAGENDFGSLRAKSHARPDAKEAQVAPVKRGLRNVSNSHAAQPDSSRVFKKPAPVVDEKTTVLPQQRAAGEKSRLIPINLKNPSKALSSSTAVQSVIADFAQLRTVTEAAEAQTKLKVEMDRAKSNADRLPVHKGESDAVKCNPALAIGTERAVAVMLPPPPTKIPLASCKLSSPSARSSDNASGTFKRRRVSQREQLDDRFLVPDFADQMYAHLRLLEHRHLHELKHITQASSRTKTNRLPDSGWSGLNGDDLFGLQTDVTSVHRLILVDWLVDVCSEFGLSNDTLHLAVHLADRYIAQSHVTRSRYQLVAAAGLYIAAKFEEITPPDCDELSHITADAFSSEQIRSFEALLFRELRFKVHTATSRTFAEYLLYTVGIREWIFDSINDEGDNHCKTAKAPNQPDCNNSKLQVRLRMYIDFLLELALFDAMRFSRFANSLLATAAVYLTIKSTNQFDAEHSNSKTHALAENSKVLGASVDFICAALLRASGYDESCVALEACVREMRFVARSHRALYATTHSLDSIVRKYACPENGCVSNILPATFESIEVVSRR